MPVAADGTAIDVGPGLDEVRSLAREHTLVPLRHTFIDDIETPVSAYLKLRGEGPSFLLESAEQGGSVGRWSFLGVQPRTVIRLDDGVLTVGGEQGAFEDPYAAVAQELERYRLAPLEGLPPFAGGAVGLFGYDLVRYAEPTVGEPNPDELGIPDLALMVSDVMLAFDHFTHTVTVLANVFAEPDAADLEARYAEAVAAIVDVRERLSEPVPSSRGRHPRAARVRVEHGRRRLRSRGRRGEGVHPRRRRLPGRSLAALVGGRARRGLLGLPRAARRQPQPVHVLPRLRGLPDRGGVAGVAREGHRAARASSARSRARARAREPSPRTRAAPRSCSRTRRSAPST